MAPLAQAKGREAVVAHGAGEEQLVRYVEHCLAVERFGPDALPILVRGTRDGIVGLRQIRHHEVLPLHEEGVSPIFS